MRDILKLAAELQARATEEMEDILAERAVVREVLEARGKELGLKCQEELRRIDQWAEQQKALVQEVFAAMIAENQADLDKNALLMQRIGGDAAPVRSPAAPRAAGKAAAAFAKAAE
jgi:hypothetical protein